MPKFTKSQQNVIDYRGKNLLVSASAGTGKTTVMIERIASLIAEGNDVSSLMVVTFTNLAATEMKKRLANKLSERRNDPRIVDQLEKLDTASICTLHSFCGDLLRNYFYVVDIDPSFAILDSVTVASMRNAALDEVFKQYFKSDDAEFRDVYKIFATKRRDENFKNTLMDLYDFSRCLEDFDGWYAKSRNEFLNFSGSSLQQIVHDDLRKNVHYFSVAYAQLAQSFAEEGLADFVKPLEENSKLFADLADKDFATTLYGLLKLKLNALPRRRKNALLAIAEEEYRAECEELGKEFKRFREKYEKLCSGKSIERLCAETSEAVRYTDKLCEILKRFDEEFFEQKKRRGGVDFNDLEHLALKLFSDRETAEAIRAKYKYVFVDEYQDTNPVQEAIIANVAKDACVFMVGDVKQSIYGFRGCDPTIFLEKYRRFSTTDEGHVEELNENFRSNGEILSFVNEVFCQVMTNDFGQVDYVRTAQLNGNKPPVLKTPSVQIDLVVQQKAEEETICGVYDMTQTAEEQQVATQGELIVDKINSFVGMAYKDKDGNVRRIGYGDIVILMRGLKERAVDIYNTLVEHNIPAMANFKTEGYHNKEVRDLICLMRAVDNPYNDVYLVGTCLSPIGGFCEDELAQIKIATTDRTSFYCRLQEYVSSAKNDAISTKIDSLIAFLEKMRFVAVSATVDEFLLETLQQVNYHWYVQGLPNGALRLRKLYNFIDSLQGATYAQSVEKFLAYLDDSEQGAADEALGGTNAVRIMTMHASKGLEFPIVIIAGVEAGFKYDYPAVMRNSHLGMATKHYDFENMRVGDTLGAFACGMSNRIKVQEEEMRLLYVAMTRAEFVLNVVGTVTEKQLEAKPKRTSAANSHLDWLLSAIKTKYGRLANCASAQINVVNEIVYTQRAELDLLCQQSNDEEDLERRLGWKYPFASQTNMPSKIVSSALDKDFFAEDEASPTLQENNDKNFVGTAYHKVYQFVNLDADKQQVEQTIAGLVNQGTIAPEYAEQLDVNLILQTLGNKQLRKLMEGGKIYREQPFMLYVPYDQVSKDKSFSDEVMLQGVIDLLILKENSAVVVDFKYTSHSNFVRQNYESQLNSYKLAVQKICGVQNVEAYVLSIADNKLIKM